MGLVAEFQPESLLFAGSLVILIYFLFRLGRRWSKKRVETPTIVRLPRVKDEAGRSKGLSPGELSRWEVEIHEMARDVIGQIDSKMVALKHLIRDADRAAERLERASRLVAGAASETECVEPPPPASTEGGRESDLTVDETRGASNQADRLLAAGSEPSSPPAKELEPDARQSVDRYQEIYTLADYGFSSAEIADRVGTPIGEVELILGLRNDRSP